MIQKGSPETSCIPKARYHTRALARRQAKHLSRKEGERIAAYRCRYCKGYHVGHMYPQKARKDKKTG